MRDKLELELHLEFHKLGTTERDPVPPLAAGDRLHLGLPDVRRSGVDSIRGPSLEHTVGLTHREALPLPKRDEDYRVDSRC